MILSPLGKAERRSAQELRHGVDAKLNRDLRYLTFELNQAVGKVFRNLGK